MTNKAVNAIGVTLALVLLGCKGPKGDQGAPGLVSFGTQQQPRVLAGSVTSDDMEISVPGLNLNTGDVIAVNACNPTLCVAINVYQSGTGINMFYAGRPGMVGLINLQSGGMTSWILTVLVDR